MTKDSAKADVAAECERLGFRPVFVAATGETDWCVTTAQRDAIITALAEREARVADCLEEMKKLRSIVRGYGITTHRADELIGAQP